MNVSSYSLMHQNYSSVNTQKANTKIIENPDTITTDKVFGYGVDKNGYFTNDFNKAAGIPEDYKIHSKGALEFVNHLNTQSGYFTNVDLARSLGNAYKIFSQLVEDKELQSFSKNELANLPNGFKYDTQSLEVLAVYDQKQMSNLLHYQPMNNEKMQTLFPSDNLNDFVSFIPKQDIFSPSISSGWKGDIGRTYYTNEDGSIAKGGVLMAFFVSLDMGSFMKGETTINGKLAGYDDLMSQTQIQELENFMQENNLSMLYGGDDGGAGLISRLISLSRQNISVEEFKEKWLEIKAESDKNKEQLEISKNKINNDENNKESQKTFTPIKGESKERETYSDKNTFNALQLFANQQKANMLSILFNQNPNAYFTSKELANFLVGKEDKNTESKIKEFLSKTRKVDIEV